MKLYNTMTRQKEELIPIEKNRIRMYVCGPTVYNLIHIGNARQLCVFDTLRRYLKYRGYNVFYIQNFTDVDDKIIKKAAETGKSASEISESMIGEYYIDASGLNIADADVHPKVTENMDVIIETVKTLVDKGFAYEANGDVYFSAEKFEGYGKLSHMPLDDLRAGASERVSELEYKADPMDFALWKAAKEGEPFWDSPFGKGRPGWHIECSAMSGKIIGGTLDIHGGGADLIFPHHENEIAQSECAFGVPLANIWMHNGMLNVDNKKMSKSKNNFFLVRELSQVYGYEPIRFMLLSAHYRSQLNYTEEVIESAVNSLSRLYNCKNALERALKAAREGDAAEKALNIVKKRLAQFTEAMDNDFNTADGLSAVFEMVREINSELTNSETNITKGSITVFLNAFNELTGVLGLMYENKEVEIPEKILKLSEQRKQARKNKDFALADKLRDEITAQGYVVEETRQGTAIRKII